MKYFILFLFLISSTIQLKADEVVSESSIKHVTVFNEGAFVTRTAKMNIPSGTQTIRFAGLTGFLDPNSIRVAGDGNFYILAVNHEYDYLSKEDLETEVNLLREQHQTLNDELAINQAFLQVLAQERELILANKNLGSTQEGVNMQDLKEMADYYYKRLNKDINKVVADITEITSQKREIKTDVLVEVKADAPTNAGLEITYFVKDAGWFSNYDMRVTGANEPLTTLHKAKIFQNTGEDWENVLLTLSTSRPSMSATKPNLEPFFLSFDSQHTIEPITQGPYNPNIRQVTGKVIDVEDNSPLLGATVRVVGTSIGAVTDLDGSYNLAIPQGASQISITYVGFSQQVLNISQATMNVYLSADNTQLDEVVVLAYGASAESSSTRKEKRYEYKDQNLTIPVPTATKSSVLSKEYEIQIPYTIASKGKVSLVEIEQLEIPANLSYSIVPKVEAAAFLTASVRDWEKYGLQEGEANLYLDGTYIGKTVVNSSATTDSLELSLGRDQNLAIERKLLDDESKKQFIGGKKQVQRSFEITVRNTRDETVNVNVQDQVPVSRDKTITVEVAELSNGNMDESSGLVNWNLNLKPKETKKLILTYTVKYPKYQKVQIY